MALRSPGFLKGLSGTYGFDWLRLLAESAGVQEGVFSSGDFKVTAAAAGGLRVDVAAGLALVKGDTGTPSNGRSQGLYLLPNDSSVANAVTHPGADATNPRIDQVYVAVNDSTDLGSGSNTPAFGVATGTPTSGATLDNRNGAAALPSNAVRLADVLIPAAGVAVIAGNVRDRRPWARGAHYSLSGAGPYLGGSAALVSGMSTRLEIPSGRAEVRIGARLTSTTADSSGNLYAYVDGAQAIRGEGIVRLNTMGTTIEVARVLTVTAGSRLFELWHGSGVAGGTSISGYELRVREILASSDNT